MLSLLLYCVCLHLDISEEQTFEEQYPNEELQPEEEIARSPQSENTTANKSNQTLQKEGDDSTPAKAKPVREEFRYSLSALREMSLAIKQRQQQAAAAKKKRASSRSASFRRGKLIPTWQPLSEEPLITDEERETNTGPIGITCSLSFSDPVFSSALQYLVHHFLRLARKQTVSSTDEIVTDDAEIEEEPIIQPAVRIYLGDFTSTLKGSNPLFVQINVEGDVSEGEENRSMLDHINMTSADARMLLDRGMYGRIHETIKDIQNDV